MDTEHALIELAHAIQVASELRQATLAILCSQFEADVGLFIATEGGLEVRSLRGLDARSTAALDTAWHAVRHDVQPIKARALCEGVATDRRVLGSDLSRTTLFQRLMAPVGGTETLFIALTSGAQTLGLVALGRCGGRFSSASLGHAKRLVPALSVACRAVPPGADVLPHLTAAQLDLLDYLELGWGAREIAQARGTSFFTVRNQLSALYRRLDVSNRAEAIGVRRARQRAR